MKKLVGSHGIFCFAPRFVCASLTYPLEKPEEDVEKLFTEDKTTASWQGSELGKLMRGFLYTYTVHIYSYMNTFLYL